MHRPRKSLRKDIPCRLELVSDEPQAKEPRPHCVFGVFVLLRFATCIPHLFGEFRKCQAKLDVTLELSCVESVLLAIRRGIELEESELYRSLREGCVVVEHMVSRIVVMLVPSVPCVLAVVPNVGELCHRLRLSSVDLVQEPSIDHSAVILDAVT